MTLDELALRYGTDKSSRMHHYTRHYERHLGHLREQPLKLLEIGVHQGLSLLMWRDWLPQAAVTGIDIDLSQTTASDPRVTLYQADQGDPRSLRAVIGESDMFDVIIDDGSHWWGDQIISFKTLWKNVRPGGWYVIEDLHTSYISGHGMEEHKTGIDYLRFLVDEMNCHGQCSGLGSIENDMRYNPHMRPSQYAMTIESITFYKAIVFIRKKEESVC